MKKILIHTSMLLAFSSPIALAKEKPSSAITQPIPVSQLVDYSSYPTSVKSLITKAAALSEMNLTYQYGSAEPKNNGMDCSGTIHYLLTHSQLHNVPRDAESLFNWTAEHGKLHLTKDHNFNSAEFSKLKPGDLLFWSGTYRTKHTISHVMMYLGKTKQGKRLMFGASDGRTYQGKKMWGVSVFDFLLPNGKGKQRFVGYSCIPKLTCT